MCICGNCPTYLELGEEDDYIVYCFPTRGKKEGKLGLSINSTLDGGFPRATNILRKEP